MADAPLLTLRPAADCRYDVASLGEVMLRLDPGEGRVRNTRSFQVWEGGGEYNAARALAKGFGLRATALTALPRSEVGLLVDDLMAQGGVDRSHVVWRDFDGVGRNTRVGLNFTERGVGVRPALGVSDRANSAAAQIRPGEFDWDRLFREEGVRWLHTGGIFAALSESTAEATVEAVEAAKRHGVVVSYDLNYRASLWNAHPDPDAARRVNRRIAASVDVMIGDEHGFATCLGLDLAGGRKRESGMDAGPFRAAAPAFVEAFPNVRVVAATLREAASASRNDWGAILYADGAFYEAEARRDLDILDRVGGGDGFVSGLAWALLNERGPQAAVDYGAAHGALAMTTPGDSSMVGLDEVEALVAGRGARAIR
jgi:2-dehydro-3-deoxygluconokinase